MHSLGRRKLTARLLAQADDANAKAAETRDYHAAGAASCADQGFDEAAVVPEAAKAQAPELDAEAADEVAEEEEDPATSSHDRPEDHLKKARISSSSSIISQGQNLPCHDHAF